MPFAFIQLPTEIQLLILHRVVPLSDRLNFRLVSTWTNTLVLEPCFWSVLAHKPRPHHNTIVSSRHPYRSGLPSTSLHPQSLAAALLQPQSDSHFQLNVPRFPSLSSSSLSSPSASAFVHDIGLLPSWTIGANLPSAQVASSSASVASSTAAKEASFLSFVSTLLNRPEGAEGVQEISVEGWESELFLDQLLLLLTKHSFDHLTKLTVGTNALERFPTLSSNNSDNPPTKPPPTCSQLTILDLKNCQHLYDLSGFYPWMPHLQEINLEGCIQLVHIVPPALPLRLVTRMDKSTPTAAGSGLQQPSSVVQPLLSLRKLNLTHTKIGDRELIRLLAHCPQLHELRLDQCYSLTPESISAIGRSQLQSQSHQTLTPEQQQQQLGPVTTNPELSQGLQYGAEANSTLLLDVSANVSSQAISNESRLSILSLNNCYDLTDESIRTLAGCRHLDLLLIRGLRRVHEDTLEWLHSQGVPLRKGLSPLGMWRHWHNNVIS